MSTMKIVVKEMAVFEQTIRGAKGEFVSRNQVGWVEFPSGELRKIRIGLQRSQEPYKPGVYVLGADSYVVNQYGDLNLSRQIQLVAVAGSVSASPARQAG